MLRLLTLGGLDLRDANDGAHPLLAQPKRLGLLVYLATAGAHGTRRRDTLLSYFWPELDDTRARGALRQATYVLRRELGDGVLFARGDDELGTNSETLWTDTTAFELALRAGERRAAAELYTGDFLEGFFVSGASATFDEWVGFERQRLRRLAGQAVWAVANELAASEPTTAAGWIRRTIELTPDDELTVRQALLLLERIGDRSGALQQYHEFCVRLAREYDAQPAAETLAIGDALRRTGVSSKPVRPTVSQRVLVTTDATVQPTDSTRPAYIDAPPADAPPERDCVVEANVPARATRKFRSLIGVLTGIAVLSVALRATLTHQGEVSAAVASQPSTTTTPSVELLIGDMQALPSERRTARALTELVRALFTQAGSMRVISRDSLLQAMKRASHDSTRSGDQGVLSELSTRNGYEVFLVSELTAMGQGYLVSARMLTVTGRELSSATVTARSDDALIPAVERLAKSLHVGLERSHERVRRAASLQRVSTASLPALIDFTEAQDLSRKGDNHGPRMLALLREAIASDPTFAMAHRRLGMALYNQGRYRDAMSELRAAERHAETLTNVERLMAQSSLHGLLGEHERAIADAFALLDIEPENPWANMQLGYQFQMLGQYAKAEGPDSAVGTGPQNNGIRPFWFNIRAYQGRGAEALDSARARFTRLQDSTGTPVWRAARSRLATAHALQYAYDSAIAHASAVLQAKGSAPLVLVASYFARGQFTNALDAQRPRESDWSNAGEPLGATPRVAAMSLTALAMLATGVNDRTARQYLAAALADTGYAGRHPVDRHIRPVLALSLSEQPWLARRALDEMLLSANMDERAARRVDFALARGAVALAEGNVRRAIDELTSASTLTAWASPDACRVCALPWLARAYEAAGKGDSALIVYERFLSTGDAFRLVADAAWRADALQRAAALHLERRDTVRAIERLVEFTELWKRADSPLQPRVHRAVRTLARLRGVPATVAVSATTASAARSGRSPFSTAPSSSSPRRPP